MARPTTRKSRDSAGLWVALGSGAGGAGRVMVGSGMHSLFAADFPYGVLTVNVVGSFLIGLIAALTAPEGRWLLSPNVRQSLMAGFCGGFTTFSFFSLETLQLLESERWVAAVAYVMSTLILTLLGVSLGHTVGGRLQATKFPG